MSEDFGAHQKQGAEEKLSLVYFYSEFCETILRYLVSRICTISQLMLGNVSPHCMNGGNNERTYQNYSNMFESLASNKIKTTCSNNRTEEIIEQHFFISKSLFFKAKRLTSLDEFVENFHLELMTSQRLFAGYKILNYIQLQMKRAMKANVVSLV